MRLLWYESGRVWGELSAQIALVFAKGKRLHCKPEDQEQRRTEERPSVDDRKDILQQDNVIRESIDAPDRGKD